MRKRRSPKRKETNAAHSEDTMARKKPTTKVKKKKNRTKNGPH